MIRTLKSALIEYGIGWTINRGLYSAKLKMMSLIPISEKLFERKVEIKQIDIFDLNIKSIGDFLLNLDKKKQEDIIDIANKATKGVITAFSSLELDYRNPINWHLNPLTGLENSKDLKWYKILDFDKKVGDIKVIWEASRFSHFLYLSRAYLITRDDKYYIAFSKQLEDWLISNPYSYGSNYKCGQEATLRMINTLISYSVFNHFELITKEDKKNIFAIVEGSYKKVLSNFFYAHKCIRNNHTFTEILGLIIGAWCSKDNTKLEEAYQLMDKEIINQFMPDGGFTQYSFNYHRFTLQIFECLYKVSEKTGMRIKETERIRKSILLLYNVQAESGDVPNYGSNDGALIFPLSTCGYRDFKPALNSMYALITEKRLYGKGDYDEELLWFGQTIDFPLDIIEKRNSTYGDSGFYILHHEDGLAMTCLQNYKSRPAHMDQLHIDLWHKGINIFCDSGTYSYASKLGNELSSTKGHNTVKLEDVDQMSKKGAFFVTNWTKRKDIKFIDNKFIGTMISQNGYTHSRVVKKTDYGYLISDEVNGNQGYGEFLFHTPCEVKIIPNGFKLLNKDELICTVLTTGNIGVRKVYRSLYYLREEEINCVFVKVDIQNNKCNMEFKINLLNLQT